MAGWGELSLHSSGSSYTRDRSELMEGFLVPSHTTGESVKGVCVPVWRTSCPCLLLCSLGLTRRTWCQLSRMAAGATHRKRRMEANSWTFYRYRQRKFQWNDSNVGVGSITYLADDFSWLCVHSVHVLTVKFIPNFSISLLNNIIIVVYLPKKLNRERVTWS